MKSLFTILLSNLVLGSGVMAADSPVTNEAADFPVTLRVDAAASQGELTPIWRFFGYDEPNYTYMKDGKKLLSELGQLGGPQVSSVAITCSRAATARPR